MATISSPGIGSGLDINSIITQLVAVERVPLTKLESQAKALETKLSTYGKVKAAISALGDAASALTRNETWGKTTGISSDPGAVTVTTGTNTKAGNYSIQVQQLAAAQSNATGVFAAPDSAQFEGTLHIELGTWDAGQTGFTPKVGATAVDISVGPPAQSLAQLRDKINASGAGVTASVLTDASGARLVLRASATGVSNAFRIAVADGDGTDGDGLGLSALAFDPSAGILTMAQALAAANASASLNNLAIASESNTLTDVLDGMTLTLNKVTSGPVQINVAQDTPALRKSLDAFVAAYNDLNKLMADQTRLDTANKTGNTLHGDSAAVAIRSQMRQLLGATSTASTVFMRLADAGLDVQRDGSIALNETKLTSALANATEARKLFGNVDSLVSDNNGIATRIRTMADRLLDTDGTIVTRTEGLRKRIDLNQDRQEMLNGRIAQVEKRLRAQYTALDRQMGQLTSLSGYITQQLAVFNNR
ncbi:MAG: flagellar filament capping protein FliD [Burkholderiaceae bacterium]